MASFSTIVEKYKEYLDLNYTKSLQDPEENPYESKYKAREVLNKLKTSLEKQLHQKNEFLEPYFNSLDSHTQKLYKQTSTSYFINKVIDFNLAKNFIETDEYESGERLLGAMLIELEKFIENEQDTTHSIANYNPLYFNLTLNCINELVFVWSYRANYEKCVRLLNKAKEIYDFYTNLPKNDNFQVPYDFNEIIEYNRLLTNEKRVLIFESIYTHSLYYMAQIYGKLEERDKSAYYCQLTLQRQIEFNNTNDDYIDNIQPQTATISFDAIEWATHSAALSQFYVCENDFATARHCLYCAEALLAYLNDNRDKYSAGFLEKLDLQCASIKRCWGKYAIALLKLSKELLLEDSLDTTSLKADFDRPSKFNFNFKNLKSVENIEKYLADVEQKFAMTTNLTLDYDQAKKVFLKAQKILQEALEYFKLDGYVSDHCEIARDTSELYALLIFYEPNIETRSKMLKRRIDILKPIVDDISEQFYLQLKRQFLFDCAEIYQQMLDIKFDVLEEKRNEIMKDKKELSAEDKKLLSPSVVKINQLAASAIHHYSRFIDTMRLMPDKVKLPDKFDTHNIRPVLLAHFYIGRLYSKVIANDAKEALENTKKSCDYYSYLVSYCDKHANDAEDRVMEIMKAEYSICKETLAFMPVKMENLRKSIKS